LEPNENTALPGLAVSDGALEIVSVTGITAGLFPAPVEVNTMDALYTPADKPIGEIASVRVAGVVLESCVSVRKLPPADTTALTGREDPSLLVIVIC
jgi:hypothetical protein